MRGRAWERMLRENRELRRKLSDAYDLLHDARDALWHHSENEGYAKHDPALCPGCKLEGEIDQFLPHPAA